ncbi:MAG: hypothetical protein HUU20_08740 [Pirellulales bacterium]|nr:hypothetical protein [Pirellulales bacterium]
MGDEQQTAKTKRVFLTEEIAKGRKGEDVKRVWPRRNRWLRRLSPSMASVPGKGWFKFTLKDTFGVLFLVAICVGPIRRGFVDESLAMIFIGGAVAGASAGSIVGGIFAGRTGSRTGIMIGMFLGLLVMYITLVILVYTNYENVANNARLPSRGVHAADALGVVPSAAKW